jgi:hypothetical protein
MNENVQLSTLNLSYKERTMSSLHRAIILLIVTLLLAACQAQPAAEPTATVQPVPPTPVVVDTPVVIDTATPLPTPTPAATPTPEPTQTPTPVPTPEIALEFVEYTSDFAGLTLSYPEEWALFDFFFVVIASDQDILDMIMDSALTEETVTFERGAILIAIAGSREDFTLTDPLELLDELAEGAEEIEVIEGPTETVINGQEATRLLARGRAEGVEMMMLSVMIHNEALGRSAALVAMTTVDGADEFLPILEAIIESAEILEEGAFD